MGISKTLQEPPAEYKKALPILSPMSGEVTALSSLDCILLKKEAWGPGCAVLTSSQRIVSPFNGKVTHIDRLDYSITVQSTYGLSCRIKIGADTSHLHGEKFIVNVKQGDVVKSKQVLVTINTVWLKQHNVNPVCIMTVTNANRVLGVFPSEQKHVLGAIDPLFVVYV